MSDVTTKLSETYTSQHHESFTVGGGSIMPASMAAHTDEEVASLLKLRR